MNFKLAKTYRYWWPVTVRVPDPENPGKFQEQQLRVQFEPLPRSEQIDGVEQLQRMDMRGTYDYEIEKAAAQVKTWEGVVDDAGEVAPFTPELLTQAMQFEWFRKGISKALIESQNGEEARSGN